MIKLFTLWVFFIKLGTKDAKNLFQLCSSLWDWETVFLFNRLVSFASTSFLASSFCNSFCLLASAIMSSKTLFLSFSSFSFCFRLSNSSCLALSSAILSYSSLFCFFLSYSSSLSLCFLESKAPGVLVFHCYSENLLVYLTLN